MQLRLYSAPTLRRLLSAEKGAPALVIACNKDMRSAVRALTPLRLEELAGLRITPTSTATAADGDALRGALLTKMPALRKLALQSAAVGAKTASALHAAAGLTELVLADCPLPSMAVAAPPAAPKPVVRGFDRPPAHKGKRGAFFCNACLKNLSRKSFSHNQFKNTAPTLKRCSKCIESKKKVASASVSSSSFICIGGRIGFGIGVSVGGGGGAVFTGACRFRFV
jgi:hypothetical protein